MISLLPWNKKDMRHIENNYQNSKRNSNYINKYIKCDWTKHPTQKTDFIRLNKTASSNSVLQVSKRHTWDSKI